MCICVKCNNAALINDPLEDIIVLLVIPGHEESGFRIIFVQDFENLVRMCGGTVIECKIDDFPVIVPVLFYSDFAHSCLLIP